MKKTDLIEVDGTQITSTTWFTDNRSSDGIIDYVRREQWAVTPAFPTRTHSRLVN